MAKKFPTPKRFIPSNPQKYAGDPNAIVSRSSWETKFMRWCDMNPSVVKWVSEEIIIPYFSTADNKMRRYFVDFMIRLKTADGKVENYLIEIKPYAQTQKPKRTRGRKLTTVLNETYTYTVNQDKWIAAKAFAEKRGMKFIVLTEKELGIV